MKIADGIDSIRFTPIRKIFEEAKISVVPWAMDHIRIPHANSCENLELATAGFVKRF